MHSYSYQAAIPDYFVSIGLSESRPAEHKLLCFYFPPGGNTVTFEGFDLFEAKTNAWYTKLARSQLQRRLRTTRRVKSTELLDCWPQVYLLNTLGGPPHLHPTERDLGPVQKL
ncbi:unnamed protein product [Arctogadus glacialis]